MSNIDALLSSESNEWYTPARYVDAAREVMGGIDIDPASNAYANEKVVHAATYYTQAENGLLRPWIGRVWLNPPYGKTNGKSNQEIWSYRLMGEYITGNTTEAVLLVNAVTDRKWFQPLWQFPICFTDHRIRFYNTEIEAGQPTHGNALVYFGSNKEKFAEIFKQFGLIAGSVLATSPTVVNLNLWSVDISQANICICGAAIPVASGRGRPAQFCSEKCANRVRKQRQRKRQHVSRKLS